MTTRTASTASTAGAVTGRRAAGSGTGTAATYRTARALMRLASATLCPTTVEGAHHVPDENVRDGQRQPVILAGNHLSACDTFFLMAALPRRRLVFLGKQEYFHMPGPTGRLTRALCTGLGLLPVDRQGGPAAARELLATGTAALARGAALALYPEGTRSPDGLLHRGRPGAAGLALLSGAPLVPLGITGTDRVQPVGRSGLRPHPVTVRFGAPLPCEEFRRRPARPDGLPSAAALRELTLLLMQRIAELSGQRYVDSFAPRPAAQRPAPTPTPTRDGGAVESVSASASAHGRGAAR
ncbi:lysophospholipid acyltransferase family protein [Streptomyces sp. NPDC048337]|uniref:lysophospholipid acyltransferase family protein n=1 Tax=Streptomyces sp. NPDC048337 TaxID=3365535 RepID=UPI003720D35C